MAIISKQNGSFGIYNEEGLQVEGSFTANSKGLNPKELLESSIGMCLTIVIQRMLERDEIEVQDGEFSIEVTGIKAENSPSRFEQFDVSIKLPDSLTDAYKKKIIVSAERACTISNTVSRGALVKINS
ncbi:OsmC family protein [Ornithinibacillus sp. BX22]|uniref:OsmC family protein n=2 Tax=Ornithinibacillus TaxID=484508 RepID=A0A923L8B0_9BACI|nr:MULTISPECIES: OsmC family protein [Ornithinibacillus]MBC5638323.1 OsmC family protein [Ornithinibacillus hominis]MBS3680897.1 OsmC family protein [Ornithinibacillus massiliensis]